MEDGDEDALKNWHIWCEFSVKKYAEEYDRLNVRFGAYTDRWEQGPEEVAGLYVRLTG
jgi:arginyl-tRNA synthetase